MWCLLSLVLFCGCPNGKDYSAGFDSDEDEEVEVLEHFEAPTLEQLDAEVEWESQRVIDGMAELKAELDAVPQLATVEEALALKNDSDESNDKIKSALGALPGSGETIDYEAELNRYMPSDIKSSNPVLYSSQYEGWITNLTGIGFFSFDRRMDPFAPSEYVVSWETSKDKMYDKLVIRDDLVWSDGTPVTAHDIQFSFELIMDQEVPIPAVRTGTDEMRWVQAYDDQTVVFFHKEPLATNIWNLNYPVIPKHVYEESMQDDKTLLDSAYHQKLEDKPICGGPYKMVSRKKGQEIVLERRDDWYMSNGKAVRPKPHFKKIRFRIIEDSNTSLLALKSGKVEDMEFQPEQWVEQTNGDDYYEHNSKSRGAQWVYYYFGWNCKTPYFEDVRVRKAMSLATDYDHILGTLCYGLYEPCTSEYHEDSWAGPIKPRTPYKQDLDKAQELLKEAGWVDTDGDGIRDKVINGKKIPFEFSIMCASQQLRVDICTSLKESLGRIGIECKVRPTEFTVMQEKAREHKFQAMFGGWGTGTDPFTTSNLWKTDESRNYCDYSNKEVDKLFDIGKVSLDRDERAAAYRAIDDILWEEQPYTFLYYRSAFYGFNKRLRGYQFSPRGPYSYGPGFDSVYAVP